MNPANPTLVSRIRRGLVGAGVILLLAGAAYALHLYLRVDRPSYPLPPNDPRCPPGMAYIRGGTGHLLEDSELVPDPPMVGILRLAPKAKQRVLDVDIAPFCMDWNEVTVADYEGCVAAGRCPTPTGTDLSKGCNYGDPTRRFHPMNCLSWNDNKHYCVAQAKRLPSEDEWEYAAQAGEAHHRYPWGDKYPLVTGWLQGLSTHAVRSYPPESFGLFDLSDNVSESTEFSCAGKPCVPEPDLLNAPESGGCFACKVDQMSEHGRTFGSRTGGGFPGAGFRCASHVVGQAAGSRSAPLASGLGGSTSAPTSSASPPGYDGPERFTRLTVELATCASTSKGHVYCWGWKAGYFGGQDTSADTTVPVQVPALDGATDVGISQDKLQTALCALEHDGELWCSRWEDGTFHHVVTVPGARALAMVADHACVLDARGDLFCGVAGFTRDELTPNQWPYHDAIAFATIGPRPDLPADSPYMTSILWPVRHGVRRVHGDGHFLCALSNFGRAECTDVTTKRTIAIPDVDEVVDWGRNPKHLCGRKSGGPWICVGGADNGGVDKLGADPTSDAVMATPSGSAAYADDTHVCMVDGQRRVSCRFTSSAKDTWTRWGRAPISITDWPVASIAFGNRRACMLGVDGTARCWGDADYLQYSGEYVGKKRPVSMDLPVPVPFQGQ